jgi:hypothetical protein
VQSAAWKRHAIVVTCVLGSLLWAVPARAELVRFTSGQVLSVRTYRVEGDVAVMALRTGGEMRTSLSVVAEVLPDEVPHPDPISLVETVPATTPASQPRGDGLYALVDRLAEQFKVDPKLAHAVVRVESNYQTTAVSPKGAMGLMQLMPSVARERGVTDPYDPEQNLSAGLKVLRELLDRYPERTALAAYNAGEGSVTRYGGIPPFRETQDYVLRVMALRERP